MSPSELPDGNGWTQKDQCISLQPGNAAGIALFGKAAPSNSSRAKLAAGKMTYSFSSVLGILIRGFRPLGRSVSALVPQFCDQNALRL